MSDYHILHHLHVFIDESGLYVIKHGQKTFTGETLEEVFRQFGKDFQQEFEE